MRESVGEMGALALMSKQMNSNEQYAYVNESIWRGVGVGGVGGIGIGLLGKISIWPLIRGKYR